jgi:hypothetical protein
MNYKGIKDKTFTCQHCAKIFNFKSHSSNHKFCSLKCSYAFQTAKKVNRREKLYEDWLAGKDVMVINVRVAVLIVGITNH